MSPALAAAAGVSVAIVGRHPKFGIAVAAVAWLPLLGIGGALWFLWPRWRRVSAARRRDVGEEVVLYGELVGLGLAAGLPFLGAAARAAAEIGGPLAAEVEQVLRSANLTGSAAALTATGGATAPLFHLVARAVTTGAAVGPAVAGFVLDARQAQRAERLAATKRLPVRLLVPLTLLILPGFVVLTLGPALLSGLGRLQL